MNKLEMQVDALMRLCTATDEETKAQAREEIRQLLNGRKPTAKPDPETMIYQILLELGAPDHLKGHPYAVQAILLAIDNRMYIDNIAFGLYPKLAAQFNTTSSRVERAIRHLIEVAWNRGDLKVLDKYFGNIVNAEKGKPTNGEFIARLANVVKLQMRSAG